MDRDHLGKESLENLNTIRTHNSVNNRAWHLKAGHFVNLYTPVDDEYVIINRRNIIFDWIDTEDTLESNDAALHATSPPLNWSRLFWVTCQTGFQANTGKLFSNFWNVCCPFFMIKCWWMRRTLEGRSWIKNPFIHIECSRCTWQMTLGIIASLRSHYKLHYLLSLPSKWGTID